MNRMNETYGSLALSPAPGRAYPQAGAEAAEVFTEGGPRASFLGREARGLFEALSPFTSQEALTPRGLRLLTELLLFRSGPKGAPDPLLTPELDIYEDSAELWLFDSRSEAAARFSWRILPEPEAEGVPLPEDALCRSLALRAYLLSCPKAPEGEALLGECERRIKRLNRGRNTHGAVCPERRR